MISGGAGRVITAIPALEKYHRLNPDDSFKVLVHGWEPLFWSNPTLQKRTFSANQKGTFDQHIKNNQLIIPEPYQNHHYYNQEIDLVKAFDAEINHTQDHSDLTYSGLHLSQHEIEQYREIIDNLKQKHKKRRVVIIQPFGSGTKVLNKKPFDPSNRSILFDQYLKIVKAIEHDVLVVYASDAIFKHPQDTESIVIQEYQPYLRSLMAFMYHADYFIGCDSVGQHVARFMNKPGMVLMGGSSEKNVSYPDYFDIIRKNNHEPVYSPIRVSDADCEFADRENSGIMEFSDDDINSIINRIKQQIGSSTCIQTENNTELAYE